MTTGDKSTMVEAAEEIMKLTDSVGWKIMMKVMATEREAALIALADVDAEDAKKIRKLQNVVYRYHWMDQTAEILIQQGLDLEEPLDEGEYEDAAS